MTCFEHMHLLFHLVVLFTANAHVLCMSMLHLCVANKAPFDLDNATKALKFTHIYHCAINVFSIDLTSSFSDVPISGQSISMLKEFYWNNGPAPITDLEVGVLECDLPQLGHIVRNGRLPRISPEEVIMAFFDAASEAEESEYEGWRTAMLTCSCTFRLVDDKIHVWGTLVAVYGQRWD